MGVYSPGNKIADKPAHYKQNNNIYLFSNIYLYSKTVYDREGNSMKRHNEGLAEYKYLAIYESELAIMAGIAAQWTDLETGGALFGHFNHQGCPIVYLITGPGNDAVHKAAHFQQDINFFLSNNRVMEEHYGLQWIGDWHSHHQLGLDKPSGGDLKQVRSVTQKNNFELWCGIIITTQQENRLALQCLSRLQDYRETFNSPRVRINTFLYSNPQTGQKKRVNIRILPGISPIRLALLATRKLPLSVIGECASCFPLDNIVYDFSELSSGASPSPKTIPESLSSQIQRLPEEVQGSIEICVIQDIIIITVPLTAGQNIDVALHKNAPHKIVAVHLKTHDGEEYKDLTKRVSTDEFDISQIYDILADSDKESKRNTLLACHKPVLKSGAYFQQSSIGISKIPTNHKRGQRTRKNNHIKA